MAKKKGAIGSAIDHILHPHQHELEEQNGEAKATQRLSRAPNKKEKTDRVGKGLASHPKFDKFKKGKGNN